MIYMARLGFCLQCDKTFEDIDNHTLTAKGHGGRNPTDAELFSGTITCPQCKHDVKTPRGKKWETAPNHTAGKAYFEKGVGWLAPDGMHLDSQHLTLTPEEPYDKEPTHTEQ